jgi:hypothetical protein
MIAKPRMMKNAVHPPSTGTLLLKIPTSAAAAMVINAATMYLISTNISVGLSVKITCSSA